LLAGLILAGDTLEDTLEQKHERKSRDAIESGKVTGDQTAKTKALNDNIIGTNQFEPFPEGWWASP
jgi:hypothetical protein